MISHFATTTLTDDFLEKIAMGLKSMTLLGQLFRLGKKLPHDEVDSMDNKKREHSFTS